MAPLLKAAALTSALIASTIAVPLDTAPLEKRITCPPIHVFGARETTAPPGYGSAGTFVNLILNAHAGATAEAIVYPAAGGTNAQYAASVQAGTPVSLSTQHDVAKCRKYY
jgi:acetylxylan esterase